MAEPLVPTASNGSLWGAAGGQLEYVGQEIVWRKRPGERQREKWDAHIRLKFTDHDMAASREPEIEPGVHYVIEVPLAVQ